MTAQAPRPRWLRRRLALVLGAALVAAVAVPVVAVARRLAHATPEYETVRIATALCAFVERERRWPSGWTELGIDPVRGARTTRLRFGLDVRTAGEAEVRAAIAVVDGRWLTFPHWRALQDRLWAACQAAGAASDPPPSPRL